MRSTASATLLCVVLPAALLSSVLTSCVASARVLLLAVVKAAAAVTLVLNVANKARKMATVVRAAECGRSQGMAA